MSKEENVRLRMLCKLIKFFKNYITTLLQMLWINV